MSRTPPANLTLTDPGTDASGLGHVRRRVGGASRTMTSVEYTLGQRRGLQLAAERAGLKRADIQRLALTEYLERQGIPVNDEPQEDATAA